MFNRIIALLLICLVSSLSLADAEDRTELKGFVLNVSSDCLLIVSIDNEGAIVRLAGVAIAEVEERGFEDAREFVSAMAMSRSVRIECIGRDGSGILLGRVHIGNTCLNDALIQAGLAQPESSTNG